MFFIYLVFSGIYLMILMKYLSNFFHIMNLLMILEFIMLWNLIFFSFSNLYLSFIFYLLFFMVGVMEACVGLGLLVNISRNFGEESKLLF